MTEEKQQMRTKFSNILGNCNDTRYNLIEAIFAQACFIQNGERVLKAVFTTQDQKKLMTGLEFLTNYVATYMIERAR